MMPAHTSPGFKELQPVSGYEDVTLEKGLIQPPTAPDWHQDQPTRQDISGIPPLAEDEVREAVFRYVSEHCCYGKGVARDMVIQSIRMTNAFHYTLETFGEKRETARRFESYYGQAVDGPENGPAPGPWDIELRAPAYFANSFQAVEVPHTAFVKPCHSCVGNGRVRCDPCSGFGQETCTWCHGSGRRTDETCTWCNGSGRKRCDRCSATGQVTCNTCNGRGNIKVFIQLIATWTNHGEDYISDTANLPKEKVREVSGQVVFQEEYPRVWPIMTCTDPTINSESNNLVQRHDQLYRNERILKQRHNLRMIPIAEATYLWKNKSGQFYVYGFENKVHFDDYPQSCCFCCTIV